MCSCISAGPRASTSTGPRTVSTVLIALLSGGPSWGPGVYGAPTAPGYRWPDVSAGLLILSSFLASAVEMVEALTIVLASGLSHGWRSALLGVAAAIVALGAAIAALGPALGV